MKAIRFFLLLTELFISGYVIAQSSLQFGGVGSFSKTNGFGGEAILNLKVAKQLSVGPGIKVIKFTDIDKIYWPLLVSVKYYIPFKNAQFYINVDPGYSIFPHDKVENAAYEKGGIYAAGGIGLIGNSKLAPYVSIQFTKYGYNLHYLDVSKYRSINTLTFTAGIAINRIFDNKQ